MADSDPADGLLHAFVLDGVGGGTPLDWDGVARWKPDDGILWLHLDYGEEDAQRWLGLASGIDPIVREALLERDPRPRALAQEGEKLLLVVRGVNRADTAHPEDLVSLRCWFEPRRMVTLRHRAGRVVKPIAESLVKGKGPKSVGDFVTTLVERTLEPVVSLVDNIDDAVAACEDAVLGEHDDELRAKIADLRRTSIRVRRFVGPQREAFGKLPTLDVPWLDAEDRARLREAADRQTRTMEELDAARERATVTHEELQSRLGDVTNTRLYVLSIITAIFLPLGFVTSLLGVNVGGVPAQDVTWAFWALLGLFAVGVGVQLWFFKRRGWF
jgi:zinc transporter